MQKNNTTIQRIFMQLAGSLHNLKKLFMPVYFFIYLIIFFGIFFLLARYFILRRKSPAIVLFMDAAKAENSGDYHEAITLYEKALSEVQKTRFHQNLKIKIIEKLKVLHTVKIYKNDQAFVRKNNSWIN